nr:hypothetical protein B0A51_01728 [Rachicladosporium sp. CCFEE 5018]
MASTTVLTIPELLENILEHLDMKTLLLSQRVNQHFNSVIGSSKNLQEKLYLRHKPSTHLANDVTLNPLLTKPKRIFTYGRKGKGWQFVFDPFSLSPEASARRMYLCSHVMVLENADLSGRNCMSYTAEGLIPLEGDDAPEHWRKTGILRDAICSTTLTRDECTGYDSESLRDFLRKTLDACVKRKEINPYAAPFAGFDWNNSSWAAPPKNDVDDDSSDTDCYGRDRRR